MYYHEFANPYHSLTARNMEWTVLTVLPIMKEFMIATAE